MFAPIQAPSLIQTVHGLTYKVMRTTQREDNEDPQRNPKPNRFETSPLKRRPVFDSEQRDAS